MSRPMTTAGRQTDLFEPLRLQCGDCLFEEDGTFEDAEAAEACGWRCIHVSEKLADMMPSYLDWDTHTGVCPGCVVRAMEKRHGAYSE